MTDRFDPEVIALLDEIARSPEGSLLKMPKRPLRHWIAAPEEVVSPHGSYLTRAEKHLVDVYREEAAWVLLERCVKKASESFLVLSTFERSEAELSERSRSLQKRLKGQPDIAEALERAETDTAARFATAALRLMPCDFGRLCLAVGLLSGEDDSSASTILEGLTTSRTLASVRAQAFESLGFVHSRKGHFESAVECDESAWLFDQDKIRLIIWAFSDAVQGGNAIKARGFLDRLGEHDDLKTLEAITAEIRDDRAQGRWKPTREARRILPHLQDRTSKEAERLIDVFR